MHYGSFDLLGPSGEFGMSGPMGVAHGTQKFWQKLIIESNHSFDQIYSSVTLPPILLYKYKCSKHTCRFAYK